MWLFTGPWGFAQTLPSLPPASNIMTGVLPNGVSYYIATNANGTGEVDMALVQKAGKADEGPYAGETTVRARGSVVDLPHFSRHSPFEYMSGNRIWPGPDGYAKVGEDATVFKFYGLNQGLNKEVVDSTLLMVFDIIGQAEGPMKEEYAPGNQAVIVAGDMNATNVLSKMNMLSMLVTKRPATERSKPYAWEDRAEAEYIPLQTELPGLASITASYRSSRTDRENIATVLTLVSRRYYSELGIILKRRLEKACREEGIPVASIVPQYTGSTAGPGDESFSITINTSRQYLEPATAVLGRVLADFDGHGVSKEEYANVAAEVLVSLKEEGANNILDNESYIRSCIASFLYGASMASVRSELDFFVKREMDAETAAKLFNNFATAILDKSKNLSLRCQAADSGSLSDSIMSLFSGAWTEGSVGIPLKPFEYQPIDTTLLKVSKTKSKIKNATVESVSGGQLWMFDNGIKVVYKNTPAAGNLFYYSWVQKGGYSQIQPLAPGEGAFVEDMLSLYDVYGMSSYDFRNLLKNNGVTLESAVSPSDFHLSGMAPNSRLGLLLKSLSALANARTPNREAFDYYRSCEALRIEGRKYSSQGDRAIADSLLNPTGDLASYKRLSGLTASLQDKAERFYAKEFSKMNDGTLIVVGNLNEDNLKKELCQWMKAFPTANATAARSKIADRHGSSRNTLRRVGPAASLTVALSTPLNQSAETYMAGMIAGTVIKDNAARAAARLGWTTEGDWDFSMFPDEAFNVNLRFTMADEGGLPASLVMEDSVDRLLGAVRQAVMDTGTAGVAANDIAAGKSALTNLFNTWNSDPYMIRSMIEMRYAYGKDLMTNYKTRIGAVSQATVNSIVASLSRGNIAEYAVSSKYPYFVLSADNVPEPELPPSQEILPASDFSYPFDGRKVPLEEIKLSSLRRGLPRNEFPADSANTKVFRRPEPEPAPADSLQSLADSLLVGADSLRIALDSLGHPSDSLGVAVDSLAPKTDSLPTAPKKDSLSVYFIPPFIEDAAHGKK